MSRALADWLIAIVAAVVIMLAFLYARHHPKVPPE